MIILFFGDSKNNQPSVINHCHRRCLGVSSSWILYRLCSRTNSRVCFFWIKFLNIRKNLKIKDWIMETCSWYGLGGPRKPKSSSVNNKLSHTILIIIYYHTMNDILDSRIYTIRLLTRLYSYTVYILWIPMELCLTR